MLVYKDAFTEDELMTDSYKQTFPLDDESLGDVAFEVGSKRVVKGAEDYGISNNDEEGGDLADAAETVIDVIDKFQYVETGFGKKDYATYIKAYMGRVKKYLEENNPSRVEPFMTGAQKLVKCLMGKFDDLQFFMGPKLDAEAGIVYGYYKEGEETPRFVFFKDGLKEQKY
eukprot:GHVU01220873.1.p2 GENE.GHVU01220873.1~~GHVU01220873.1.p2  ORF type:complete len:171 (+),score=40.25 GHVU01220873.1:165-677(+)